MSNPSDVCADCGHLRSQHNQINSPGGVPLVCLMGGCVCPAFDEGVTKTGVFVDHPALPHELALKAAKRCSKFPNMAFMAPTVEMLVEDAVTEALVRIKKPDLSRIQAGERAVVEAALAWWPETHRDHPAWWARAQPIREAVDRLRDLHERKQAEECTWRAHPGNRPGMVNTTFVKCHIPAGHDGRHRGNLGDYEWGASEGECNEEMEHVLDGRSVRCDLIHGHDGPHEGDLGRWKFGP